MPARQLTWLITGCSSGIGLAITRRVLNEGHKVIATSRNPSRTPELVQEVESQGGRWVKLDVNEPDSGKVIENLEGEGSAVDVLVNNAGFSLHQVIEGFTEREARDQMETIFFGPFRLLRAAVPHMRRRRFGVVVNISAGAGLTGRETMGVYGAGKAAMDNLFQTLAKEVEPFNIRTLTCNLGGFNTNMQNAIQLGEQQLPTDYDNTVPHKFIEALKKGTYPLVGDKDKAARQIFDVVVAQGAGEGRASEPILPLGPDIPMRFREAAARLNHAVDVFEAVSNSVAADK